VLEVPYAGFPGVVLCHGNAPKGSEGGANVIRSGVNVPKLSGGNAYVCGDLSVQRSGWDEAMALLLPPETGAEVGCLLPPETEAGMDVRSPPKLGPIWLGCAVRSPGVSVRPKENSMPVVAGGGGTCGWLRPGNSLRDTEPWLPEFVTPSCLSVFVRGGGLVSSLGEKPGGKSESLTGGREDVGGCETAAADVAGGGWVCDVWVSDDETGAGDEPAGCRIGCAGEANRLGRSPPAGVKGECAPVGEVAGAPRTMSPPLSSICTCNAHCESLLDHSLKSCSSQKGSGVGVACALFMGGIHV
jgi:hypothetical protein